MSVAAQMIDQSMPWSPEENTCRPTVTGRDSTEFVTIRAAAPDMPRGEANRYPRASEGRRAAGQARTERLIPCKSAVSRRASLPSRRWMAGGDSKWLRCRVWPRVSRGLSTKGSGTAIAPKSGCTNSGVSLALGRDRERVGAAFAGLVCKGNSVGPPLAQSLNAVPISSLSSRALSHTCLVAMLKLLTVVLRSSPRPARANGPPTPSANPTPLRSTAAYGRRIRSGWRASTARKEQRRPGS